MSTIILGCDRNANDTAAQNTVAKILEKAGNTVEKLPIGPNYFASYSYSNKAKGKIGIYLMAASLVSVVDLYGGNTQFKYAYFGIRGDVSKLVKSEADIKTKKIPKDHHGDCKVALCDKWAGKTYAEINNLAKSKCQVTAGSNPEELGNNLVKAMGGETSSDSDSGGSSSSSSAKECIQKLLTHWDGEVECFIRGEKVYINKIKDPKSDYHLLLQEGVNIISDSLQITDVNPNTVNHLTVKWTEGTIVLKDEELITRFGKIEKEIQAVKKVVQTESKTKNKTTNNNTEDTSSSDDSSSDDSSSDSENTKTTVLEEPITNKAEALKFANLEWNKIKRDNGHTIECQVLGSSKWREGEWVKVIIPSFNENCFMYITRASSSDDAGDWTCNLSLADYPPGWGKEETSTSNDDDSDTSDETEDEEETAEE